MSNAYDNEVFDRSVEGSQEFEIPIKSVQRYEVTDSNLGNYSAGQLKFNLNQLATSSSYIDWKKSHLVIPITLSIASSAANGILGANQMTQYFATLKNSFTSLIDSIVFSVNNTEVVSKTGSLMNIPLHFKLMTTWDGNDVAALGSSMGFYPDSSESFTYSAARGELNNSIGNALDFSTRTGANAGRIVRHYKTVASLLDGITGSFYATAGNFGRLNTAHKSYNDTNATTQTMNNYIECVIPLRYVHDVFEKLPMMRGSACSLLVNTHLPSTVSLTLDNTGTMAANTARSVMTPNSFLPFMVSETTPGTHGNTAAVQTLTFRAIVGNVFNSQTQLRLSLVEFNPEYEQKLIKSPMKQVYYNDWYCFPNQTSAVAAGSSVNAMLNVNIPKLRRLLIVPKIATNGNAAEFQDAYLSPFTSAGCTTTPALISNLQVFISGKPIYQSPLQYSWEQFLLEVDGVHSVNGGIDDGLRAGLIDRDAFEKVYGFCLVSLGRKDSADDVIEKSIQISFTNNNNVAMSYSYFIEYERGWEIDVVSGKIVV